MKRVFKAEIIWDTDDEHGLVSAVSDLCSELNTREAIEAIEPHVYPENPIVIVFTPRKKVRGKVKCVEEH